MKKLSFLFSVLVLTMMAQTIQTIADDKCTDVTITYVASEENPPAKLPPSEDGTMFAWNATHCGDTGTTWKTPFTESGKKWRLNNGKDIRFSASGENYLNSKWITLTGSPVKLVCTCTSTLCGNSAIVSPQTKGKK